MGINMIAGIAGSFIGLIVGGILADINWRLVFWVSVPVMWELTMATIVPLAIVRLPCTVAALRSQLPPLRVMAPWIPVTTACEKVTVGVSGRWLVRKLASPE